MHIAWGRCWIRYRRSARNTVPRKHDLPAAHIASRAALVASTGLRKSVRVHAYAHCAWSVLDELSAVWPDNGSSLRLPKMNEALSVRGSRSQHRLTESLARVLLRTLR